MQPDTLCFWVSELTEPIIWLLQAILDTLEAITGIEPVKAGPDPLAIVLLPDQRIWGSSAGFHYRFSD